MNVPNFALTLLLLLSTAGRGFAVYDTDPNEPEPTLPPPPEGSSCRDQSYAPIDKVQPYKAWQDYEQKVPVDDTKYEGGMASWEDAICDTSIKAIEYTRKDPKEDEERNYVVYLAFIRRASIKQKPTSGYRWCESGGSYGGYLDKDKLDEYSDTYREIYATVFELKKQRRLKAPSRGLQTCPASKIEYDG